MDDELLSSPILDDYWSLLRESRLEMAQRGGSSNTMDDQEGSIEETCRPKQASSPDFKFQNSDTSHMSPQRTRFSKRARSPSPEILKAGSPPGTLSHIQPLPASGGGPSDNVMMRSQQRMSVASANHHPTSSSAGRDDLNTANTRKGKITQKQLREMSLAAYASYYISLPIFFDAKARQKPWFEGCVFTIVDSAIGNQVTRRRLEIVCVHEILVLEYDIDRMQALVAGGRFASDWTDTSLSHILTDLKTAADLVRYLRAPPDEICRSAVTVRHAWLIDCAKAQQLLPTKPYQLFRPAAAMQMDEHVQTPNPMSQSSATTHNSFAVSSFERLPLDSAFDGTAYLELTHSPLQDGDWVYSAE